MHATRAAILCLVPVLLLTACARNLPPDEALARATELVAGGESGEARIVLKNLLVEHPATAAARAQLALIALAEGDVQGADAELRAVDASARGLEPVRLARLRTDLALGRHDSVLADVESQPALPARDRALLRALALRVSGRAADGLADLRAASAAAPADQELLVEIANALIAIGNPVQAERELDAFIARGPGAADALLARADLKMRQGAVAAARADAAAALETAPPSWPPLARHGALLLLCEAELAEGRIVEARKQVEQLEASFPGSAGAQLVLARIASLEGRDGDAIDILQRLLAVLPANPRVQFLLVDSFVRSGNVARAAEILERRIAAVPGDGDARRLLARLRLGQSRPDQVVSLLADADGDAGAGRDREAENLLSMARVARERAAATISEMTAKRAAAPTDPEIAAQLASAYLQSGDPTRASATLAAVPGAELTVTGFSTRIGALLALASERELNQLLREVDTGTTASVAALVAAADVAQRAGRTDVASRLVQRAAARAPTDIDVQLRVANIAWLERRLEEAANVLRGIIERQPGVTAAEFALARIAEAQGDVAAARGTLAAAIRKEPAALEPALMLAALELRNGDSDAARNALDGLLAAAPRDGRAARAAGTLLFNARRYEEARTRFRTAVDQNRASAEDWFNLGRAQLALEDYPAAGESWQQAARLQPDGVAAHVGAVRVALRQGDQATASRLAQSLATRLPENPIAWMLVGEVATAKPDYGEASRAFVRSYVLRPTGVAAVGDHRARVAGGLARAEQPLENWLAREPDDQAARRLLAEHFIRVDRPQAAIAQLATLLERQPNDVVALNNIAWLLAERDAIAAEKYARRAYSIAPQSAAVGDTLGWVLIQLRRYAEAATVLAKAAELQPADAAIRYHLALALSGTGNHAAAKEQVNLALAQNTVFSGRDAAAKLLQELSR